MSRTLLFLAILSAGVVALLSAAPAFAQAPEPELVILGNGQTIASGDSIPDTVDGTDFGSTTVGEPVVRLFLLQNQGDANLSITSISVPNGFALTLAGGSSVPLTLPPSGVVALLIECEANEATTSNDFVSVESNDPGHERAGFAISCRVNGAPEIDVSGNTLPIANGDSTPSVTDGTEFGVTPAGTPITQTFRITNRGEGDLNVGEVDVPEGFTLVASPASTIAPAGQSDFQVRCDAEESGDFTGNVSIENNDVDEDPFTFLIHCAAGSGDEPAFNPGEDDLPDATPPPSDTPEPVTSDGSNSGSGDSGGGSSSGGDSSTGGGTVAPQAAATATRTPIPTPVSSRSSDAQGGSGQSVFRPPSTGSGGVGAASSDSPGLVLLAATAGGTVAVGAGISLRRRASSGR